MTLFEGNVPQNDKKRERDQKKAREREGTHKKRASELDAKCYGNCRKQGTTG